MRIKVMPHCDAFMQGDVYGNVVKVTLVKGREIVHVLMDRSNKVRKFSVDDLKKELKP